MVSGEFKGWLDEEFRDAGVRRRLESGAGGDRRRRRGRRFHERAAAEGGDGGGAGGARGRRIPRVAFLVRGPIPARQAVQAVTEGLILAGFSVDQDKTGERFGPAAAALTVPWRRKRTSPRSPALEEAVRRGQVLGDSSNLARG